MLVEYVKDNYYARFHDPSYHRYREINSLQTLMDRRMQGQNDGRTDGKLNYIAPCYKQVR